MKKNSRRNFKKTKTKTDTVLCEQNLLRVKAMCFSHSGLAVDASVGFSQSLNDLQSIEELVGTFNPQQLLPAQTLPILQKHTHTQQNEFSHSVLERKTKILNL